jgi:hypothetical protein
MDSNHRRREPADLQSAPVGHLGNLPNPLLSLIQPHKDRDVRVEVKLRNRNLNELTPFAICHLGAQAHALVNGHLVN